MSLQRVTSPVLNAVDSLVHREVIGTGVEATSHRLYLLHRLGFVALVLALTPAMVALSLLARQPFGIVELALLAAALSPVLPVSILSLTGRLDLAQAVGSSILALTLGITVTQASGTTAILPAILPALLILLPLEAGLQGRRADIVRAGALAVLVLAGVAAGFPGSAQQAGALLAAPLVVLATVLCCLAQRDRGPLAHRITDAAKAAQTALDSVADMVLTMEVDGKLSYLNAAAQTCLGRLSPLKQTDLLAAMNVADRPAFLMAMARAAQGCEPATVEIRLVPAATAEGSRQWQSRAGAAEGRWFDLTVSRVASGADEDAPPVGEGAQAAGLDRLVLVFRDVTDRKLADEARESARLAAEKLAESKSQFLATMSHELRTPLNAIIGFSEMLADPRLGKVDEARSLEYARIIHGSGQHLLEVVNAILDMSKIEAGMMSVEQEPVSLPAVIRSSVELLQVRAAGKRIAITTEIMPDLPELIGDRRAIKQVLLNLLSNAVKFTPEAGQVAVTLVRDRDMLELAVSDSGCGMSSDNLARIGTPFFQVRGAYDRQHEGTGLGLSVVRGLIGLMGGQMLVESAEGAGTRVAIRLPIGGQAQTAGVVRQIAIETRVKARAAFPPLPVPAQPAKPDSARNPSNRHPPLPQALSA